MFSSDDLCLFVCLFVCASLTVGQTRWGIVGRTEYKSDFFGMEATVPTLPKVTLQSSHTGERLLLKYMQVR